MTIGERLRSELAKRNIKQRDFALKIGLHEMIVSRVCNDSYNKSPDVDTMSRIAKGLDVTIDYLVNGTAPNSPTDCLKPGRELAADLESLMRFAQDALARFRENDANYDRKISA